MSRSISELSSEELMSLVRRGELDELRVLEVLRSPFCTSQIAEEIASNRSLLGAQAVKEKLAGFPGFTFARAMDLLSSLPWTSLLAVAQNPRTPPVVRRQAERKLIFQVPSMSLGEKIAMARRAHRALFPALTGGSDEKILTALLDNPRMVENDVVVFVNTGEPPVEFYGVVARHRKWGQYYGVRRALVECSRTPLPLALSIMVQLPRSDHKRMAGRKNLSDEIREAAAGLFARASSDSASESARK
jgi:hypothetical protein